MSRENWSERAIRAYLTTLERRLRSSMLPGRISWEVCRPRRNFIRLLMQRTAVNVFVTAQEEPGLGGNLYFEPDSRLYMAEYASRATSNNGKSTDSNPTQANCFPQPTLLDHCIDNLRESLMCTGDMTFSPTVWDSNKGRFIPDFEVEHTCRDYDALKKWSLAREADKDRWRANAARLHEQQQHR
ncbi:MAG: hypothetical protein LQ346_008849 [Caloplaca aetnensis]|nr:MAG: hypothetical protein LQ346_008849 [Caloplaca aetnensis]